MSAPAAKAFSEPVRTMAEMEGSLSAISVASLSSWKRAELRALSALGRLKVISVTPATGEETRMFWYSFQAAAAEDRRGREVERDRVEESAVRGKVVRRAVRMVEASILGVYSSVCVSQGDDGVREKRCERWSERLLAGCCPAHSESCSTGPENPRKLLELELSHNL